MISFVFSDTYKGWLQSMNSREDKLENEWDSFMRRWFSLGKGDIIFSSDVFMPNSERKQYKYYNTSANFINVLEFSKNSEAMNFLEQRRIRGYENAFIVSVAFDRTKKLSEELKSKGF